MVLEHGGNLRQASIHYNIPINNWLDLSTGINPNGWKVPLIPATTWSSLPEDHDGLEAIACEYYNTEQLLPIAGSQAAIQILPMLRRPCHVGVLHPSYGEHEHAWKRNGHHVTHVTCDNIDTMLPELNVLIIINPNNPTGAYFPLEKLLSWHKQLSKRNGWLIIDEAFIDTTPQLSLASHNPKSGLIILRSFGKFFGLAGIRLGFICAQPQLLAQLSAHLAPWATSNPARWIGMTALQDTSWHQTARQNLIKDSSRLQTLLNQNNLTPTGSCPLFQWVSTAQAKHIHAQLAQQGIWSRLFSAPLSLPFGLPENESDWQRLDTALKHISKLHFTETDG